MQAQHVLVEQHNQIVERSDAVGLTFDGRADLAELTFEVVNATADLVDFVLQFAGLRECGVSSDARGFDLVDQVLESFCADARSTLDCYTTGVSQCFGEVAGFLGDLFDAGEFVDAGEAAGVAALRSDGLLGEVAGLRGDLFDAGEVVLRDGVVFQLGDAHTQLGEVGAEFLDGVLQRFHVGAAHVARTGDADTALAVLDCVKQARDDHGRLVAGDGFVTTEGSVGETADNAAVLGDLNRSRCPVSSGHVFEFNWLLVLGLTDWSVDLTRWVGGLGVRGYAQAQCGCEK